MVYGVNRGQNMSQGNYIQVNDQGTFRILHTRQRDSFYQNRDLKQTAENRSVPRIQKIIEIFQKRYNPASFQGFNDSQTSANGPLSTTTMFSLSQPSID